MTDHLKHFHFSEPEIHDNPARITHCIYADVVDTTNNAIVDACVKEARRAGINDVYLLDRDFVLAALREKIERMRGEAS